MKRQAQGLFASFFIILTPVLTIAGPRPLALSGTEAVTLGLGPNLGPNITFGPFGWSLPTIDEAGNVSFVAPLNGELSGYTPSGIFVHESGVLSPQLLANHQGHGPTPRFVTFYQPAIGGGSVAFSATFVDSDSATRHGIWVTSNGAATPVAKTGLIGAEVGLGADAQFFGFSDPVMNSSGTGMFSASIGGASLINGNGNSLWTFKDGSRRMIAATTSPGPLANTYFLRTSKSSINADGRIAFIGSIDGAGVSYVGRWGVWTYHEGQFATVALSGNQGFGPKLEAGVAFDVPEHPSINDAGDVAFTASLVGTSVTSSNDSGLWATGNGSLRVIAREGPNGPSPGLPAGVYYSDLRSRYQPPLIRDDGSILYYAVLSGNGVDSTNDKALFTESNGRVEVVARTGADGPGPGLGSGINFSAFDSIATNKSGDVVIAAKLAGTRVSSFNDEGIWTITGGQIAKVVRTGDVIDVDLGAGVDLRTVISTDLLGRDPFTAVGSYQTLTDTGMFAFRLQFGDGSTGIFTATVPEPGSLLALSGGIWLILMRRRTNRSIHEE